MSVITRFAPSPTGKLHIGGARTALFNYLYAIAKQGKFFLRIDDTDPQRCKPEFLEDILDKLAWLKLSPEAIFKQSDRQQKYNDYCQLLLARKAVYLCKCPARSTTRPKHCCLSKAYPLNEEGVLRLIVSDDGFVQWNDTGGKVLILNNRSIPDFAVRRADKSYTYDFCSVVDDIDYEISHVLRGDDHLTNTGKHLHLYRAFNATPPIYQHLPMVVHPGGKKLSKRDSDFRVDDLYNSGYLPSAITNYLAYLGASYESQELLDLEALASLFSLEKLHVSPAVWNLDKLQWFNFKHMSMLSCDEFQQNLLNFSKEPLNFFTDNQYTDEISVTMRTRSKTMKDFLEQIKFLGYKSTVQIMPHQAQYHDALTKLEDEHWHDIEFLSSYLHNLSQELNIDFRTLAAELRQLLIGKTSGVSLNLVLKWLGKQEVCRRLTS